MRKHYIRPPAHPRRGRPRREDVLSLLAVLAVALAAAGAEGVADLIAKLLFGL